MDDMYWLPDSEIRESIRNKKGHSSSPEPPAGHGVHIYNDVNKAIEDSKRYRYEKKIDAPPLLRIKMEGRAEYNESAVNNGFDVEYSYPDGYDLVSVSDTSLESISIKAREYMDTFDGRRKNKTLFNALTEITANTQSERKMSKEISDMMKDNKSVRCQISMVAEGSGNGLLGQA